MPAGSMSVISVIIMTYSDPSPTSGVEIFLIMVKGLESLAVFA